jgi:hypothetical protein
LLHTMSPLPSRDEPGFALFFISILNHHQWPNHIINDESSLVCPSTASPPLSPSARAIARRSHRRQRTHERTRATPQCSIIRRDRERAPHAFRIPPTPPRLDPELRRSPPLPIHHISSPHTTTPHTSQFARRPLSAPLFLYGAQHCIRTTTTFSKTVRLVVTRACHHPKAAHSAARGLCTSTTPPTAPRLLPILIVVCVWYVPKLC